MSNRVSSLAAEIGASLGGASTVPQLRAFRRTISPRVEDFDRGEILALALRLIRHSDAARYVAYELVQHHRSTAAALTEEEVVALGEGLDSWHTVDGFAYTISGRAWKRGNIDDHAVLSWTESPDVWWRRAALASSVILHRSPAAERHVERAMIVCEALAADREDMVVKALSWALREVAKAEPERVHAFLARHDDVLHARVKREVANKLRTGLKNPRR